MGCTSSKSTTAASAQHDSLGATERVMKGRRGIDKSERIHTPSERARLALSRAKSMAITSSSSSPTNASATAAQDPLPPPPKLNSEGQLIAEEVVKRISGSVESKDCILGELKSGSNDGLIHVQYAALTQRGYYPDNPHKSNQDAYTIQSTKFASGEGDAYFAVFDGHGDTGHDCAQFAKNKLHLYLSQNIKKLRAASNSAKIKRESSEAGGKPKSPNKESFHPRSWPYLSVASYEKCVRMAHLQSNRAMHDDKTVKDAMSGTTAISVAFHAGRMTVSNVGDSRAVLGYRQTSVVNDSSTPAEEEKKEIGEEDDDDMIIDRDADNSNNASTTIVKLVAIPLSEDQTPYRKDERDRLRKAGARICSIDQMEGIAPMHDDWGEVNLGIDIDEEGDPPRVWCQDHNYPGTAFSRSLGDTIGEGIGVNAEPEMFTKEVTKGDEILVIASDGIFEFLTNQRVIDICEEANDPLHACTRLLEESYKMWLHYELRTDDITCIVLFMKNSKENDEGVMASLQDKIQRTKKKKGVVSARDLTAANYDERTTPPAGDDDAAEFEIFKDFLGGVQKVAQTLPHYRDGRW